MKHRALTIVGIAGLVLILGLIVLCGGAGVGYYRYSARYDATVKRGEEFGHATDQGGCVEEGLRQTRNAAHETFADRYETLFIHAHFVGCLQTCKPTAGFRDGAPRPQDYQRDVDWSAAKCLAAGLAGRPPCHKVFERVITECAKVSPVSSPN
jgi:hypothetical protein